MTLRLTFAIKDRYVYVYTVRVIGVELVFLQVYLYVFAYLFSTPLYALNSKFVRVFFFFISPFFLLLLLNDQVARVLIVSQTGPDFHSMKECLLYLCVSIKEEQQQKKNRVRCAQPSAKKKKKGRQETNKKEEEEEERGGGGSFSGFLQEKLEQQPQQQRSVAVDSAPRGHVRASSSRRCQRAEPLSHLSLCRARARCVLLASLHCTAVCAVLYWCIRRRRIFSVLFTLW